MNDEDTRHWDQLAGSLRDSACFDHGDDSPPPGFATRVLAQWRDDTRQAWSTAALWRRWTVAAAATCCLGYACIGLALPEPPAQFLPLPELELSTP